MRSRRSRVACAVVAVLFQYAAIASAGEPSDLPPLPGPEPEPTATPTSTSTPTPTSTSTSTPTSTPTPKNGQISAEFGLGDVLVSTERAAPFFIVEHNHTNIAGKRVATVNVVSVGDTPTAAPVTRAPRLSIDVVLWGHVTFGGSVLFSDLVTQTGTESGSTFGIAPRLGLALPVTEHFAIWPRAGVAYASSSATTTNGVATGSSAETSATIESVVAIFPGRRAALTFTPSLDIPLESHGDAENYGTRFMITVGMMGRFDGSPDDPKSEMDVAPARAIAKSGHILLSIDRLLSLVQYTNFGPSFANKATSVGLTHAYTPDSALGPRLAGDLVVGHSVTLGGTASLDITPYVHTSYTGLGAAPNVDDSLAAVNFQLGFRTGWICPIADHAAIWLRGGLTYAFSIVGETTSSNGDALNRANELYASLDPEAIFFVTGGFALTAGPVLDATLVRGDGGHGVTAGAPGPALFGLGGVMGAMTAF